MSLHRFEEHLRDPAPSFRCYACGDRSEKLALTARVSHQIGKPASKAELAEFNRILGAAAEQFREFVALHDGVMLYIDALSETVGVEIYRVADIEDRTTEMRQSMTDMGFDEDDLPKWFVDGVAIGEIPQSANYFVIGTAGEYLGKIFYADHDDFDPEPLASSFDDLLAMIVDDPAQFLYDRGCYTRYSDGKSDTQWIPKEYVPESGI